MLRVHTLVCPTTLIFKLYLIFNLVNVEEMTDKKIPSTDLVEMAEFILKNHLFEFETKIIQQISGTTIGTKFAPHMHNYLWIE